MDFKTDDKFPLLHPKQVYSGYNITDIGDYLDDTYYYRKDIDFLNRIDSFYTTNLVGMNRRFIKGRFYIFNYRYSNDLKMKSHLDTRPFIFVLEEQLLDKKYLVKGINLNYLGLTHKVEFMEMYMKFFDMVIQYDVNNLNKNELLIYKIDEEIFDYFKKIIFYLFQNLKEVVRQWDVERIIYESVDFISPKHYNIVPFYNGYLQSVKGEHWLEISKNIILNRV
jgi:hypothetical protein